MCIDYFYGLQVILLKISQEKILLLRLLAARIHYQALPGIIRNDVCIFPERIEFESFNAYHK